MCGKNLLRTMDNLVLGLNEPIMLDLLSNISVGFSRRNYWLLSLENENGITFFCDRKVRDQIISWFSMHLCMQMIECGL